MKPRGGVLIVDNSAALRQSMLDTIAESFGQVPLYTAGTGAEAIERVLAHQPDVIFIDIGLPGEDGLKVAKNIKAIAEPLIIIVSDYDTPEYREAARQNSADGFLSKETLVPGDILDIITVYANTR